MTPNLIRAFSIKPYQNSHIELDLKPLVPKAVLEKVVLYTVNILEKHTTGTRVAINLYDKYNNVVTIETEVPSEI